MLLDVLITIIVPGSALTKGNSHKAQNLPISGDRPYMPYKMNADILRQHQRGKMPKQDVVSLHSRLFTHIMTRTVVVI